jgi:hypothetical protein
MLTQRASQTSISSIDRAYRSSSRPTISAAAMASASVHPFDTVFSVSALDLQTMARDGGAALP